MTLPTSSEPDDGAASPHERLVHAEPPSPTDLAVRLREEAGNPDHYSDNRPLAAARLLHGAAEALDRLTRERDGALRLMSQHAREAGEATGRLEMSEAAGIVEGWRERAETAERERDEWKERAGFLWTAPDVDTWGKVAEQKGVFIREKINGLLRRAVRSEDELRASEAALAASQEREGKMRGALEVISYGDDDSALVARTALNTNGEQ